MGKYITASQISDLYYNWNVTSKVNIFIYSKSLFIWRGVRGSVLGTPMDKKNLQQSNSHQIQPELCSRQVQGAF